MLRQAPAVKCVLPRLVWLHAGGGGGVAQAGGHRQAGLRAQLQGAPHTSLACCRRVLWSSPHLQLHRVQLRMHMLMSSPCRLVHSIARMQPPPPPPPPPRKAVQGFPELPSSPETDAPTRAAKASCSTPPYKRLASCCKQQVLRSAADFEGVSFAVPLPAGQGRVRGQPPPVQLHLLLVRRFLSSMLCLLAMLNCSIVHGAQANEAAALLHVMFGTLCSAQWTRLMLTLKRGRACQLQFSKSTAVCLVRVWHSAGVQAQCSTWQDLRLCANCRALRGNSKLYLMCRACQFFTPGIPMVYYVGLFAGKNDWSVRPTLDLQACKVGAYWWHTARSS